MMTKQMKCFKKVWMAGLIVALLTGLCAGLSGCSAADEGLHILYADADKSTVESNYGKGNYIYHAVTFTGDALGKETVLSVKELEEAAENPDLGYQGTYSLLSKSSALSTHEVIGVRLYELLLSLGMDESLPDETKVTAVSADGYTLVIDLGDLRGDSFGRYSDISSPEPKESGLPILLGFGSDGVPLVGPTGSEKVGKLFSEEEGYNEKAENSGGPVRLIMGQTAGNDYNAPKNAKWITQIIVGDQKDYALHDAKANQAPALTVSLYDKEQKDKLISSSDYTFADLESSKKNIEQNYYGQDGYYQGVNLWNFLTKQVGISSQEGTVTFLYKDGKEETVSLEYIRNLGGDFEDYTSEKDGLTLTCLKPALGYSKDGTPSDEVYALLPAKEGMKKTAGASACSEIKVVTDGSSMSSTNPYAQRRIGIKGTGVKKSVSYTVAELEGDLDLQVTDSAGYSGISLSGLLKKSGLTVDAQKVTITGETKAVSYDLETLDKQSGTVLLATRKGGNALDEQQGPIYLTGDKQLQQVTAITIEAKEGQWTHETAPYNMYQDNTLTITGSEAKAEKFYTLKELEELGSDYTVKDSFAASSGTSGFQGVNIRALVEANLKSGMKQPSKVTIIGKDGYEIELSVQDIYKGVDSKYQQGEHRDLILAYSINGIPMVPEKTSEGYTGTNAFGPLRLVVENQISKWVKNVQGIRLGD